MLGQKLPSCSFPSAWLGIYCPVHIPTATIVSLWYPLPKAVQQRQEEEDKLLEAERVEQYLGSCRSSPAMKLYNATRARAVLSGRCRVGAGGAQPHSGCYRGQLQARLGEGREGEQTAPHHPGELCCIQPLPPPLFPPLAART